MRIEKEGGERERERERRREGGRERTYLFEIWDEELKEEVSSDSVNSWDYDVREPHVGVHHVLWHAIHPANPLDLKQIKHPKHIFVTPPSE